MVVDEVTDDLVRGTVVVDGAGAAVVAGVDRVGATGRKVTTVVETVPAETVGDRACEECHHHPPAPAATKTATSTGPPSRAPLDFFRLC
jgi:hypothetical protein